MASTIKLKTSVADGNVPASLSKGEVAINVADGVWYYGGESGVQQNFKFATLAVTGDTSLDGKLVVTGNTVMNGTLSATTSLKVGNGNGSVSAATIFGVVISGTIGKDSSPVTAYINAGEIDNVTLGSEDAVAIEKASIVTIENGTASNVPLLVKGHAEQSTDFFQITDNEDNVLVSVPSNGRLTCNAVDFGGGAIDGTPIGTSARSSGKFTTMDVNSTLVVTGNTTLNGTLSATTSLKVGNGDGTISAATITSSGDMTAGGDVYTDVVRRQSDSSTTTKIKLDDETIKCFGSSSSVWSTKVSSQLFQVGQAGAGLISAATATISGYLGVSGNTYFPDNGKAIFGAGDDLKIYHSGSHSIIQDAGAGDLQLKGSAVRIRGTSVSEDCAVFTENGSVELYYDNAKKFETTSNGISASTNVTVGNGDGLVSAATVSAVGFVGTKHVLRNTTIYVNDNPLVQNSLYFGHTLGTQPSNWNDPQAVGGAFSSVASFTIAEDDMSWGYLLPCDVSKVEIQCSLRPNLGDGDDFSVVMYTGIRSNDSDTVLTLTKVAIAQTTFNPSVYTTNDLTYTGNLNKNTMIYVGVGSEDATDAKNAKGILNITVTQR